MTMTDNYDSGFDLVLSDYERGYLTAYFYNVIYDSMADCCDEDWFGVQVGDRMFDLNAWADEDTGKFVCVVYECDWDATENNWKTNCRHSWTLTEENEDE
jgi:hypothetical protein